MLTDEGVDNLVRNMFVEIQQNYSKFFDAQKVAPDLV